MITFKRVEVKRETRTVKHTDFNYEYKLDYVGRYVDGILKSISKHETKFFDRGNGIKKGLYMNPIRKDTNLWIKASTLLTTTIGG